MSSIIRRAPEKTLERYLEAIKEGKIPAWVFIKRLDAITQDADGEPTQKVGIEIIGEGFTSYDYKFLAAKLVEKSLEAQKAEDEYDLGLIGGRF